MREYGTTCPEKNLTGKKRKKRRCSETKGKENEI